MLHGSPLAGCFRSFLRCLLLFHVPLGLHSSWQLVGLRAAAAAIPMSELGGSLQRGLPAHSSVHLQGRVFSGR